MTRYRRDIKGRERSHAWVMDESSVQQRTPLVTFAKENVEVVEEENKLVSYSVIDGEILNLYKNFKATLSITPKGEGMSLQVKVRKKYKYISSRRSTVFIH
ncbi:MLP-like protein 423 [Carex littledalei]|uniref:MLP-like protein 423 n=1 Tax=Carex littledalei TaxID=544730 RepID=A0A833R287_9POAL|nr:MLP-like protein 423 [Carex littledalei]